MARILIMVRPKPATVPLREPNPVFTTEDLEVVQGALTDGDTVTDLGTARFTTSRNYPNSNAAETVGMKYKVSATGLSNAKYDIRYQLGTLTVV